MYLAYGSYIHAAGMATISIQKSVLRSEIGTRIGYTEQWTIDAYIKGDDVPSLTVLLGILEAAYSFDGYNIVLFNDDGSPTQHSMISANAQGGVRVVSFGYPDGDNTEYVTMRKVQIVLEGRFVSASRSQIVAWSETLSFTGDGGPRFIMQQPLLGYPQKWQVASRTPFYANQSGQAVIMFDYPNPPGPLFPDAEHRDRRQVAKIHPQIINGVFQNYGLTWSYEFESINPLFGNPTPPQ